MNLGPYREDPLADNVITASIFPILAILCFMYYPDSNGTAIIIGSIFIVMTLLVSVIIKIKKWKYYASVRVGIVTLFVDIALLFLALTIARMYNSAVPAILLLLFLVITIILGHKFPKQILSELNSPRTKIGKLIVFLAFFGSAIGSIIGYWSVKTVGPHLTTPVIFMVALIVVGLFHANFHLVAIDTEKLDC